MEGYPLQPARRWLCLCPHSHPTCPFCRRQAQHTQGAGSAPAGHARAPGPPRALPGHVAAAAVLASTAAGQPAAAQVSPCHSSQVCSEPAEGLDNITRPLTHLAGCCSAQMLTNKAAGVPNWHHPASLGGSGGSYANGSLPQRTQHAALAVLAFCWAIYRGGRPADLFRMRWFDASIQLPEQQAALPLFTLGLSGLLPELQQAAGTGWWFQAYHCKVREGPEWEQLVPAPGSLAPFPCSSSVLTRAFCLLAARLQLWRARLHRPAAPQHERALLWGLLPAGVHHGGLPATALASQAHHAQAASSGAAAADVQQCWRLRVWSVWRPEALAAR